MSFRKEALKRLGRTIRAHEEEIYEALRKDLNKSKTEAYMCEIGMTLAELSYMLKHIDGWARKRNMLSQISLFFGFCSLMDRCDDNLFRSNVCFSGHDILDLGTICIC